MKLIVSVEETFDRESAVCKACVRPNNDEERFRQTYNDFSHAEEVARLTEVAQEIERAVNTYYSKDRGLMPRVVKPDASAKDCGWELNEGFPATSNVLVEE